MHRQGRAGRYGARGVAISMVINEAEATRVVEFVNEKNLRGQDARRREPRRALRSHFEPSIF